MPNYTSSSAISAVIAHYGPVEMTASLVADLKAQVGPRVEIIVSDDASPTAFPSTDGVTSLRSENNGGYGAAINRGARVAQNPWLLILNSDIRLDPDFLTSVMPKALSLAPAVFGFRHFSEVGSVPSASPFPTISSTLGQHCDALQPIARRMGWNRAWLWSDPDDESTSIVGWVSGAAMLLPTQVFRAVGGFDERFYMYSEEVELQRRLQERGVPAIRLGAFSVRHTGAASTASLNRQVEQLRSRLLYEEITRGPRRRRLLEWGLRSVLVVDTAYQHARCAADRQTVRLAGVRRRREVLDEATRARPA